MGEGEWVVAVAGGDPSEQGHGQILTDSVAAAGRIFRAGAGWSWRRSLDAEQSIGVRPSHTVIQLRTFRGFHCHTQMPTRSTKPVLHYLRAQPFKALRRVEEEFGSGSGRRSYAKLPQNYSVLFHPG
jgi:hypothetical protein